MTNTERALFAALSRISPLNDDEPAPWGTYPVVGESHTVFIRAKWLGRDDEGQVVYYIDPAPPMVMHNAEAAIYRSVFEDR